MEPQNEALPTTVGQTTNAEVQTPEIPKWMTDQATEKQRAFAISMAVETFKANSAGKTVKDLISDSQAIVKYLKGEDVGTEA